MQKSINFYSTPTHEISKLLMKKYTMLLLISSLALLDCVSETADSTASTQPLVACSAATRTSGGTGSVTATPVTNNDMTQAELTEILQQVNAVRARGNCTCPASGSDAESTHQATAVVSWNTKIETAAAGHSKDMVDNNFFSHTGSSGSSLSQRITAAGYSWTFVSENIAAGQSSVNAVMQSWLESGGHCRNIMSTSPTDMGVSLRNNNASASFSKYWTMNFGKQ